MPGIHHHGPVIAAPHRIPYSKRNLSVEFPVHDVMKGLRPILLRCLGLLLGVGLMGCGEKKEAKVIGGDDGIEMPAPLPSAENLEKLRKDGEKNAENFDKELTAFAKKLIANK